MILKTVQKTILDLWRQIELNRAQSRHALRGTRLLSKRTSFLLEMIRYATMTTNQSSYPETYLKNVEPGGRREKYPFLNSKLAPSSVLSKKEI